MRSYLLYFLILVSFLALVDKVDGFAITLQQVGIQHTYPPRESAMFGIDFNVTTRQANYVWYLNKRMIYFGIRDSWKNDPYGLPNLPLTAFSHPYECVALVEFADGGNSTTILSNAVPLLDGFYGDTWSRVERYIRNTPRFIGMQVIKGCQYTSTDASVDTVNTPIGCYYIIRNIRTMDISGACDVIDYGYFQIRTGSMNEYKLPFWIERI